MSFLEISKQAGEALKTGIPKIWDGRNSILEMKNAGSHYWKQMEWIGFYFQFLCEQHLSGVIKMPGPVYGSVQFDGLNEIPWDFKAHAMNTTQHEIIFNDSEAITKAIKDHGSVGVILSLGKVLYNDEKRTFKKWHDKLKGKRTKYEKERIKRGAWSRLRKVSFDLQQISFIKITKETIAACGSFQKNFRNADGSPRNPKVLIDLEKIGKELEHFVEF